MRTALFSATAAALGYGCLCGGCAPLPAPSTLPESSTGELSAEESSTEELSAEARARADTTPADTTYAADDPRNQIFTKSYFEKCLNTIPSSVPGLRVSGNRLPRHVIRNMVPFVCFVQHEYSLRLFENPDLLGRFELRLFPEPNGEINHYEIINSTVNDSVFMLKMYRAAGDIEFEFLGASGEESEIVYPIILGQPYVSDSAASG
jgi:hypothetical protein